MLFEESDPLLRIFSRFSDDVLDSTPERHLYRNFIFSIRCDEFSNDTTHPLKLIGIVSFRLHDRSDTRIVSLVSRLQFL